MLDDLQGSGLFGLSKSEKVLTGYNPGNFRLREEEPEKVIAAMYDLAKLEPGEEQLLCVFSVLPAEPIAFDTLEALQPGNDELERSLRALVKQGWIEFNVSAKQFKCSPVVQAVTRLQVGERLYEQCETLVNALIEMLVYEPNTGHLLNTDYQQGVLIARYAENVVKYLDASGYRKVILFETIGSFYSTTGNLRKALVYFEEYRQLREHQYEVNRHEFNSKYGLTVSYLKLGDTNRLLGNLENSLIYYVKRLQVLIRFCESNPEDPRFVSALAVSCDRLGFSFFILGDQENALSYFKHSITLRKELYKFDPKNTDYEYGLSVSFQNMGDTYKAIGDMKNALRYFEDSMRLSKKLYEIDQNNVSFKYSLAISFQRLGSTYSFFGDFVKTLFCFEEKYRLSKELYDAYPTNVIFKDGLAISYGNFGVFSRDQRSDKVQARRWFEKAEELWSELVNDSPGYAEFQNNLAWVKTALATL
jgi:tetratricopeptide (TPR) repeat protein